MEIETIIQKVGIALDQLYNKDAFLFDHGLCERSINHRFAIHLQHVFDGYFVDCEYNRSHLNGSDLLKQVSNVKGNYIDIIMGKRDMNPENDLVCFEVKKWSNGKDHKKDRENLKVLTKGDRFCYTCGFYIIFGKKKAEVKVEVYQKGKMIKKY